ncbi:hypothetical protein K3495_g61 [Podosphaera aphanis]|nr:hypothetical protein K3495_g61 [Podosphaera aphanis]
MAVPGNLTSIVRPIGYSNNSCGYCKNGSESYSYYANADDLTVELYQKLLDHGWRRSGVLLYKPDLRTSCCPHYTIRLDSLTYRPSKDQRQTLNRFNKHIIGQAYLRAAARLYPRSREQAFKRKQEFDLVERVHESEQDVLKHPPDPDHKFTVEIEPSKFTEEKYLLFENYQRNIHHEPPTKISRNSFQEFLCDSPLRISLANAERMMGTVHQCYRIDGKLIAMGVIDLLPQCVSAVYFMYDETVKEYNFGKLGAMREIALARELGYRWWYPGFYIHNCVKMRYKGDYLPQFILDPESYQWDLMTEDIKSQLNLSKYLSLSGQRNETKHEKVESVQSPVDINENNTTTTLGSDSKNLESKQKGEDENLDNDGDDDDDDEYYEDDDYGYIMFDDCDDDDVDPRIPLFQRNMPGVLTRDQLLSNIDLGNIDIQVGNTITKARNLSNWDTSSIDNCFSMKGIIASLMAAVGIEQSHEMVIKLG